MVDSVRNNREYFIYGCLAMFLTSILALCYSFSNKKKARRLHNEDHSVSGH